MSQKRIYVDDGAYFVTARTFQYQKIFNQDVNCQLFLSVLDKYHKKMKFCLYAYAVMPDHVHLLILPRGKFDISDINHRIKGNFAFRYRRNHKGSVTGARITSPNPVGEPLWFANKSNLLNHKGSATERGLGQNTSIGEPSWFAHKRRRVRINPVWQKSFHDRIIRSDEQLFNTIQYINCNAVKHQLVDDLIKWPYSSFHNYNDKEKALIEIDYLEA